MHVSTHGRFISSGNHFHSPHELASIQCPTSIRALWIPRDQKQQLQHHGRQARHQTSNQERQRNDKQAKATSAIAGLEVDLANAQDALVAKEHSRQDAMADKKLLEQECLAVKKDIEDVASIIKSEINVKEIEVLGEDSAILIKQKTE